MILLRRFSPIFLLALLPCLLLYRVVFFGEAFVPADLLRDVAPWRTSANPSDLVPWNPLRWDGIAEFYPWRWFASSTIRDGWLPLWNPHEFCGTPFVANSQSAVFYPFNLLFYVLPVKLAFGASAWLHLTLTGTFFYAFLRRGKLELGRAAAMLGATVWQLSAWQTAWLPLPTFLCVSTWLPLALLLTDGAMKKPTAARAAMLGTCLGVMFLAGHLQIALYGFLLTAAYAIFRAFASKLPVKTFVALATLVVLLTAGFVAPQILPALELSRVSHRAGAAANWTNYQGYLSLATRPIYLTTLVFPSFFGTPSRGNYWGVRGPTDYAENAGYLGLFALFLVFVAVFSTFRSRPETRFFAVAALVTLLMALGTLLNAPLFFLIPGFAQTGSPGRILVLWTFCASILAGIGLDALRSPNPPAPFPPREGGVRGKRFLSSPPSLGGKGAGGLGLLALLSLAYTAAWVGKNYPAGTLTARLAEESDVWRLAAGVALAAAALLTMRRLGRISASAFGKLSVGLAALDLLAVGIGVNPSVPMRDVYPLTPAIAFLSARAGTDRILPLNRRWNLYAPPPAVLPPNAATVYGLFETQGYDSLLTGRCAAFAAALNGDGVSPAPPENGNMIFTRGFSSPLAAQASARWIVSLGPPPDGLTPVFSDGVTVISENKSALARARVTGGTGNAKLTLDGPNRLNVTISDASQNGELTIADQWFPGWTATVNGREAKIDARPEIFRTIRWENSSNSPVQVEMRYEPTTFKFGLYAFCLAVMTAAGLGAATAARRASNRHGG